MRKLGRAVLALFSAAWMIGIPEGAQAQGPFVEHDIFSDQCAQVALIPPAGAVQILTATGEVSQDVFFPMGEGSAADTDSDGREQVPTEIVALELTGTSPTLGAFTLRQASSPASIGEHEETANLTPGTLDVPPFASPGSANSSFDLFFELEFGAITLHNTVPRHFSTVISHKPPGDFDYNSSGNTPLLDDSGGASGYSVSAARFDCDSPLPLGFVLSCFYECKRPSKHKWDEVTTLMVANHSNRAFSVGVAFRDGNQNIIAQSQLELPGGDLDELNVCRSLEAGGISPPSAGLVELLVFDSSDSGESASAWMKNLIGLFDTREDEPFEGKVRGIAKTQCQAVSPAVMMPDEILKIIAETQPPLVEPVLIEETEDTPDN